MPDSIKNFWKAVDANDVEQVRSQLLASSTLVKERYAGVAWKTVHTGIPFSNTALHTASVNSRCELAKVLIETGADVDAIGYEENKGLTPPIVLAVWEGSIEMLELLLDAGADANLAASAETALYCAAEHKAADKVALLLQRGAHHNIFTAAMLGESEMVKRMATAYPPLLKARSLKRNRTAKEEAQHHGQQNIVELLNKLE